VYRFGILNFSWEDKTICFVEDHSMDIIYEVGNPCTGFGTGTKI
jgi:hypothetical protein